MSKQVSILYSTIRVKYLSPEEREIFSKQARKQVRYFKRKQARQASKQAN